MSAPQLIRYHHPHNDTQVALVIDDTVYDLQGMTIADWLQESVGRVEEALDELVEIAATVPGTLSVQTLDNAPAADAYHWLPPIDKQEVWAAGVTYTRSREARQEEAEDGGDVYARVYDAERPELFFKAMLKNTVGHLGAAGIRADSHWNVPEPELGIVLNPALEVVGFTVGNDMSSRDIEGANPLYLPQAKVYTASCALGPGLVLSPADEWPDTTIRLTIARAGEETFSDDIHTDQIKRTMADLIAY